MTHRSSSLKAFTLTEIMVSIAIVALAGIVVVELSRTGMILFSKNSAINVSAVQGQAGLLEMKNDLNAAVSTPEFILSSGTVSPTVSGSASGIYFQSYAGGPFSIYVTSGTNYLYPTNTSVQVETGTSSGGYTPIVGETVHIQATPTVLLEKQITSVSLSTSSPTVYTLGISGSLGMQINLTNLTVTPASKMNVACFITSPVKYQVQQGSYNYELVKSVLNSAGAYTSTVLAYGLTNPSPFTTGSANGSADTAFISTINFTAVDPTSTNLGKLQGSGPATSGGYSFVGATTPFTLEVSHYAQLTVEY
ncbi:MAG TPA: hypothetical protein VHY22_13240 [Chthoniobacteraceae bacterium]|jgi:competence protein ComGC|nr:hypothetical protein [Chthoniobacteraceae bacterium]